MRNPTEKPEGPTLEWTNSTSPTSSVLPILGFPAAGLRPTFRGPWNGNDAGLADFVRQRRLKPPEENPMPRPNILVFFTDQQRWDTCGCYGQRLPLTPHLDRLAAEGVRFERAFTNQPVCGPARAILQTGRYATEVGCHVNHRMLPVEEPTVAKALGQIDG
jgi:hypothetical protein